MSLEFFSTAPDTLYEYEIDWRDHPTFGRLPLDFQMTMNTSAYEFADAPAVRLLAPTPTFVTCCKQGCFNYDLDEGQSVLLADNADSMFPVHLHFDTPVAAVGAYVSADAAAGRDYVRQVAVRLEGDTQWTTFTLAAPLSKQRGTAPFLAVRANGGSRIEEIGFDVMNVPGNTGSVRQVAIGSLFFTP
jgi:hypothetical protein